MKEVSGLLKDESVLCFADGEHIKGSDEVAKVILGCCEEYLRGYRETEKKTFVTGMVIGAVVISIYEGFNYFIKRKKKSKKLKEEA